MEPILQPQRWSRQSNWLRVTLSDLNMWWSWSRPHLASRIRLRRALICPIYRFSNRIGRRCKGHCAMSITLTSLEHHIARTALKSEFALDLALFGH